MNWFELRVWTKVKKEGHNSGIFLAPYASDKLSSTRSSSGCPATHTYLTGKQTWSTRGFFQGEAVSLHSDPADPCDYPKRG